MRTILLLSFLLYATLHADFIEDYIQKEITVERSLNLAENNATDVESRLGEADQEFLHFFVKYVSHIKGRPFSAYNPYRSEIFQLKRRIATNQRLGNHNAVLRDELKVASIAIKRNIRETMYKTYEAANGHRYDTFEKSLEKIIIDRYKKLQPLDLSPYTFVRQEKNPQGITKDILNNLEEYSALEDLHNDLSAALIEGAPQIYKTVILSGFGILTITMTIEESLIAHVITPMLEPLELSTSKLFYIILAIFMTVLLRFVISKAARKLFIIVGGKEEDAQYLLKESSRPFSMISIAIGVEVVFMIYSGFNEVEIVYTLFKLFYVVMSFFLLYRLGNAIAVVKIESMNHNEHVRNEVINLSLKMMNVVLGLVALIWVLKIVGVNLTALLSGLGIGGVAVAFAAKDTIANFFGSVSILLSDLFEQGDWITVDNMEGNVVEIGLRATTIRTFDNALIAIPNFKLADNGIKNWSRRQMGRRIKMSVGVTYESDMEDIKKAIAEIKEMLQNHKDIMSEKTQYQYMERQRKLVSKEDLKGIKRSLMVFLDEFNHSSIDILIYCFSRSVVWDEWFAVKEDVMFKVAEILKRNHLEFAYPTMVIHQAKEEEEKREPKNYTTLM